MRKKNVNTKGRRGGIAKVSPLALGGGASNPAPSILNGGVGNGTTRKSVVDRIIEKSTIYFSGK
jgi:hypothetical protein